MNSTMVKEKTIIGLEVRTTNENMQALNDIGLIWQQFMEKDIPSLLGDSIVNPGVIYGAYYDFEKDHTKPYSFIAGVEVKPGSKIPEGLSQVKIPEDNYTVYETIEGELNQRIGEVWERIWNSSNPRKFNVDFEVYDYTVGQVPDIKVLIA